VSDRRGQAEAALRALGLDPARLAGEVLEPPALQARLATADAAAVLAALAEVGDARVAAALAVLDTDPTDRATRKALRRALHRLRERGIAVPVAAPAPPAAPRPPAASREAWLSAVDGVGTRLAWLARPLASGALLFVATELTEAAGLADLRVSEIGRKRLRNVRTQLRENGIHMVAAPFEVVDALVVEGQQRNASTDQKVDYLRVRPRLTEAAPLAPAEPRSDRIVPPTGDEIDPLTAASATLLSEPEFARWWPDPAAAEPFLHELDHVQDSPIVLSPAQQESRLAATLVRAAEALYPRPSVARRLAATAYVLAETGRGAAARMALAVAQTLAREGGTTREIPLLATLTHQGLGRLAAARAAQRQRERQDSLVVTPGEALRDRSPGHPPRTRS
jgi:hypothetical protein